MPSNIWRAPIFCGSVRPHRRHCLMAGHSRSRSSYTFAACMTSLTQHVGYTVRVLMNLTSSPMTAPMNTVPATAPTTMPATIVPGSQHQQTVPQAPPRAEIVTAAWGARVQQPERVMTAEGEEEQPPAHGRRLPVSPGTVCWWPPYLRYMSHIAAVSTSEMVNSHRHFVSNVAEAVSILVVNRPQHVLAAGGSRDDDRSHVVEAVLPELVCHHTGVAGRSSSRRPSSCSCRAGGPV